MLTLEEVQKINRKSNVIPLVERLSSDLDTPVSVYMKLRKKGQDAFLLESIEGGEKLARYSFIGVQPFLNVEGNAEETILRKGKSSQRIDMSPFDLVKELFQEYRPYRLPNLPRFTGGGVGYFSYDTIRWFEKIPDRHPKSQSLPEMHLGLYALVVAFDHLKQEMIVISNILHEEGSAGLRRKYSEARNLLRETVLMLKKPLKGATESTRQGKTTVTSLSSKKEFTRIVEKAKKYIYEGDIFQVVLSRRWKLKSSRSPLDVYRRLRGINPSPYMFLLESSYHSVIGSSPEMLVRVEGVEVETRPIAGTRPRGKDEAEDALRASELRADPKEVAEHTMLLDLGRNDVGRVSKPGSVRVVEQMKIEKYSHVIHLVSSVKGSLADDLSPLDAHAACFPAGTVSGAPKVRAMEIIDELEPLRRGIYAGSIAYLDFWGNLDSCIAIRTVVYYDKTYYVQAGAGIVADSVPEKEYEETEAKGRGMIVAITGGDK